MMTYGGLQHRRQARNWLDLSPLVNRRYGVWAACKAPVLFYADADGIRKERWLRFSGELSGACPPIPGWLPTRLFHGWKRGMRRIALEDLLVSFDPVLGMLTQCLDLSSRFQSPISDYLLKHFDALAQLVDVPAIRSAQSLPMAAEKHNCRDAHGQHDKQRENEIVHSLTPEKFAAS